MMWIILCVILLPLCYLWLIRPQKYWTNKGVKQGSPKPILGDMWTTLLRKYSAAEMAEHLYNMSPNTRYYGVYNCTTPILMLRDPDLIKQITVKDFDHFTDRYTFLSEKGDPIWTKTLLSLTGEKWREMRSTLSPCFTSSKMRHIFMLISQSSEQFVQHFLKQGEDLIALDIKDTFSKYASDVIANSVFGLECNCLVDQNNEFYLMGKDITNISFRKVMKFLVYIIFPKLSQYIGLNLFSAKIYNFFLGIVKENIASREKFGITRPDMINILMEARKHGLKHEVNQIKDADFAAVEESDLGESFKRQKALITDEDVTAQAMMFFVAGFDSVSSGMCFVAYELSVNPDVQERLIQEVDEKATVCNGTLTYEVLLSMKYMDMVVSESLRKWPPPPIADRLCTKPYTIEPKTEDEVPVVLAEKALLWIPIYALHRDPQYYPDPDRFDPERFNEENKTNINPYTYLPFGAGPRNCIGSRFGLLEIKALFFHILSSFQIVPIEKTQIPPTLSGKSFTISPKNGLWLGLKRRHKLP